MGTAPTSDTPACDIPPVSLEITFATARDAARALSARGPGRIFVQTARTLPADLPLTIALSVPGWSEPMRVEATVAACDPRGTELELKGLDAAAKDRLKEVVRAHLGLVERLRLRRRAAPARIEGGRLAAMWIPDGSLADECASLLGRNGWVAMRRLDGPGTPDVVISNGPLGSDAAAAHPGAPFVLVNVSGPGVLAGRLSRVRVLAYVPRPANASRVVEVLAGLGARSDAEAGASP